MRQVNITSACDAVKLIRSGMTVMVGGFMAVGTPEKVIDALVASPVGKLTVICNDAGLPDKGVGKLIAAGKVKKLYASHIGLNRIAGEKMTAREMEVELIPQGTLAEQIRAGGAGLGGVLTKTGVGTLVQEGKQTVVVNGETFLLEAPLKADVSLLKASRSDVFGNLAYDKTTKNFNIVMATAASKVVAEVDEVLETEDFLVETALTPSILVDHVVRA
ncbi:CoA transferase subunit A [Pseudovibrio exalbescens]|uniref:CoA transferase subunit A n=1 Tax=Pseudovibrio exalbescens TaxID=197461 RepID=UPI000C998354|nr:CoA transferase subunit A [Pseudovibrio exalbescens]